MCTAALQQGLCAKPWLSHGEQEDLHTNGSCCCAGPPLWPGHHRQSCPKQRQEKSAKSGHLITISGNISRHLSLNLCQIAESVPNSAVRYLSIFSPSFKAKGTSELQLSIKAL